MFGIRRITECVGCGAETKLSMRHMCNICDWAISQRKDLDGVRQENEMKADEIKYSKERIEASIIEGALLLERNIEVRAELTRVYREIETLKAVK